jgi:dTDP-glucose 4,6-dehydratase
MKYIVTGGCGFIGSNLVRHLQDAGHEVSVIDNLTYASDKTRLKPLTQLHAIDIADQDAMNTIFKQFSPDGVFHLAAESHMENSVYNPGIFVKTNVLGTLSLLNSLRLVPHARFVHVSTDEVYGSLGPTDPSFTEDTSYDPKSPYSASKAASDHLVKSYVNTYGVDAMVTNCSNNYGVNQHVEKLIPRTVSMLASGRKMTIHGGGQHVRDWIHVDDHARALVSVMNNGVSGRSYNIGGMTELSTIDTVRNICRVMGVDFDSHVEYVTDRPGNDHRYSVNSSRIMSELGWSPTVRYQDGIRNVVNHYIGEFSK